MSHFNPVLESTWKDWRKPRNTNASWTVGQDFNTGPSEYKTQMLTIQMQHLVGQDLKDFNRRWDFGGTGFGIYYGIILEGTDKPYNLLW
jgi:hypothetical protein